MSSFDKDEPLNKDEILNKDTEMSSGGKKGGDKDSDKDYEDICYVCRRPESKAGKMIHLPINNICVCQACMQRSIDAMNNSGLNYADMMKQVDPNMFKQFDPNMMGMFNMQDLFGPNMNMNAEVPKAQRIKKKKPADKKEPVLDIKNIPPPHKIKQQLDDFVIGQEYAKKVISVARQGKKAHHVVW